MILSVGAKSMKRVSDVVKTLNAVVYNQGEDKEIIGGYAGDFLSFVMGRAPSKCAWFTVMTNVNVCAVATLADVGVIVLCEGVEPSEQLLAKVKEHGVNLIGTEKDVYEAVVEYSKNEN